MEVIPTLRQYNAAERRLRQSIGLADVIDNHTYPRREQDLATIRAFHSHYGMPPSNFAKALLWLVGGGGTT